MAATVGEGGGGGQAPFRPHRRRDLLLWHQRGRVAAAQVAGVATVAANAVAAVETAITAAKVAAAITTITIRRTENVARAPPHR